MKFANNLFYYCLYIMMACLILSASSCNTARQVKEVFGDYDRHPAFGTAPLLASTWQEPRLSKYRRISHAYTFSRDTFVITLIDMNNNQSFVNSEDVVVISSIEDSVAPIIPATNRNAAFFMPDLKFEFYGHQYELSNVSSDGERMTITKLQSIPDYLLQAIATDQISKNLRISEMRSTNSFNFLEIIQEQHTKYVLVYFWLPGCAQCFESIPTLNRFEANDIGIINIFQLRDDEIEHMEGLISRFRIPGKYFQSSPELIKHFSQNGFPFSVLIDVSSNRILLSDHLIEAQERYLKL